MEFSKLANLILNNTHFEVSKSVLHTVKSLFDSITCGKVNFST